MKPYEAAFPIGTLVRIVERSMLLKFLKSWTHHNPLNPEQLESSGQVRRVQSVGYYHGGDPLYVLENTEGVWHEQCLTEL